MATSIVKSGGGGKILKISGLDADSHFTDWPGCIDARGIRVKKIVFCGGADGNVLSIKDNADSGIEIFPFQGIKAQGPPIIMDYDGELIRPLIDFDKCVLTTSYLILVFLA